VSKVFPAAVVRTLCELLYDCVGRSDEELDRSGIFVIAYNIALGQVQRYSQYRQKALIAKVAGIVGKVRDQADKLMLEIDPDGQVKVLERANQLMDEVNASLPQQSEEAERVMRSKAKEACKLIEEADLDIVRVRKLLKSANSEESEEAKTAAVIACKTVRSRGLQLGPKRS